MKVVLKGDTVMSLFGDPPLKGYTLNTPGHDQIRYFSGFGFRAATRST